MMSTQENKCIESDQDFPGTTPENAVWGKTGLHSNTLEPHILKKNSLKKTTSSTRTEYVCL